MHGGGLGGVLEKKSDFGGKKFVRLSWWIEGVNAKGRPQKSKRHVGVWDKL